MTPKAKAIELVEKLASPLDVFKININSKRCALIAVDEILTELPTEILDTYKGETHFIINDRYLFWQEVKTEIEKL